MLKNFFNFTVFSFAVFLLCVSVSAQNEGYDPFNRNKREEPLPENVQENLKKMEVDRSKKDHNEMIENGEEAVKLSEEVVGSFDKNNKLSSGDFNKLERIEKLLKKIRSELGGSDDDETDNIEQRNPFNIQTAVSSLKNSTAGLVDELKKTSRFSISAVAIQSSNSLIDIVRFLRIRQK